MKKNKKFIPGMVILTTLVAGAAVFSGVVGSQAGTLAEKYGTTTTKNIDRAYTLSEGTDVNTRLEEEGASLLVNKDNALPLSSTSKVTILGAGSHNYVQGGTGSAGGKDDSNTAMMNSAFEAAGIDYNEAAWQWLDNALGNGANVHNGSIDTDYLADEDKGRSFDFTSYRFVNEFSKATYEKFLTDEVIGDYKDVAVVTFSRSGAEGASPSLDFDGNKDTTTGKVYLELQENEIDLLKFCKAKFKKTIVLINSAVPMECGFANNDQFNVEAVLWIGHPGEAGINGVAKILSGKVNPSGHVVDTWTADMSTNPTFYSADDQTYSNIENNNTGRKYYQYNEGIYVGYRYYETADSAGYFDSTTFKSTKFKGNLNQGKYYSDTSVNGTYAEQKEKGPQATYSGYEDVVSFPFGYGLSYTTFEQSVKSSDIKLAAHGENSITVTVKNTGSVAGKSVVQLYMESPYGEDSSLGISGVGLEKAKVVLVGFAKTSELAPGAKEDVTITFSTDDIASYDEFGKGTYVLEKGKYTFHISPNAHGWANEETYGKDYATVEATLAESIIYGANGVGKRVATHNGITVEEGKDVTNQMNDITAGDGTMLVNGGASGDYKYGYLSRKDFAAGMKEIMSFQSDDYTGKYSGNGYVWSVDGNGTTPTKSGVKSTDGNSMQRKAADNVKEQIELKPKSIEVNGVSEGKTYNYASNLASGISFGDGKSEKKLYGYGNDAYENQATTYEGKSVDDESYLKSEVGTEIKFGATYYVALDGSGNTAKASDGYVEIFDTQEEAAKKGTATKLQVNHMAGVSESDFARWDKLANELTFSEADNLIGDNGWHCPAAESVGKKYALATDGPGEAGNAQNPDCTWWNCAVIIAATWNADLAKEQGVAYGHQDLLNNTPYAYAPAMNIHRTPFGGRDFEYYSEDGFISGIIGGSAASGMESTGLHVFIKHYALNDSDTNRGGVCTWADEASIREIYARPFEIATKYYKADGIMGSLNRMGMAWAHTGFYQAMTRDEWKWGGMLVTDGDGSRSDTYNNYSFWTMCNQGCILGSGQLSSNTTYRSIGKEGDGANNYIKYLAHRIGRNCLYQYSHNIDALNANTVTNPNYTMPIALIIGVDAVLLVAGGIVLFSMVLPKKKKSKKAE